MNKKYTQTQIIFFSSLYFLAFYNYTFFSKVVATYPLDKGNVFYLFSVVVILFCAIYILQNILNVRALFRSSLIILFLCSTLSAYVMDSYSIAIDDTMLLNILQSSGRESIDLLTTKLGGYLFFLFIIPSFIILKIKIKERSSKDDLYFRAKYSSISLLLIIIMLFPSGKFYASFFREQKLLRYYTNPTYYIYSLGKFASRAVKDSQKMFTAVGRDSIISQSDGERDLVILVIGETARRDRFSLNGHSHDTNPLLKKENVMSFQSVTSCGTSTAISVPCLFSNLRRKKFSVVDGKSRENLLDVLTHTKNVDVLWRDNNSNSKGVADRVRYEDFKTNNLNAICDETECRDVGMLVGLQEYIDKTPRKDILIVLHQMGNHGPAYYKRYPKTFEIFKPVCNTGELSECTNEQIGNTYDNAILYTDYFLSKVIRLLKENNQKFNTAMLYVSDHGESLGENGVYLHGMPYVIAPKEQIEIPLVMWFGESDKRHQIDYVKLHAKIKNPFSHDNLFHTMLGLMEVQSNVYDSQMDILDGVWLNNKK